MLRLFGGAVRARVLRLRGGRAARRGLGGPGGAVAAAAAAGPRRALRRLLPGRGRADRASLRRLTRWLRARETCALDNRAVPFVGRGRSKEVCAPRLSTRSSAACTCSRAWWWRATTAGRSRSPCGRGPVQLTPPAAARVCAVRRDHLPGGSARAADGRRRRAADRAAGDPGARCRAPGRLPPGASLRRERSVAATASPRRAFANRRAAATDAQCV